MEQRINIITLGVHDLTVATKFYEALGFKRTPVGSDAIAAFQLQGIVLCLYPEELLAEDATVDNVRSGFRGVTLAYNARDKAAVDAVLEEAKQAGATIVKEAQDVFWGGYSGYFADPSGHLWEVAWNPHWPLQADGSLRLTSK